MKIKAFIHEVMRLCKNSGVKGKELDRLVGNVAELFSKHNERIAEKFEGELNRNLLLSSDTQERNEAILRHLTFGEIQPKSPWHLKGLGASVSPWVTCLAILKCIRIMEKETGLVLSTIVAQQEE